MLDRLDAPRGDLSERELQREITSYAVLNEPARFVIAYYLDHGENHLQAPLYLWRHDRRSGEIVRAEIDPQEAGVRTGSALRFRPAGDYLYLPLHFTPSASDTLALTDSLEPSGAFHGWPIVGFEDGRMVFHHSQVHFAPVHAVELSVFDPHTRSTRKIYPLEPPQRVRREHIAELTAGFAEMPESWFRENNRAGDPTQFDTRLVGAAAVDEATDSVAFVISYLESDFVGGREAAYFVRDLADSERLRWVEVELSELRAKYGERPLDELLSLEMLDQILP